MRILDCKSPDCRQAAPTRRQCSITSVDGVRGALSRQLKKYLTGAWAVKCTVDPRIVRGLDYYTPSTVFEIVTETPGGSLTVCGGGRYDGLVQELGGPGACPVVGFGMGIERMIMVHGSARQLRLLAPPLCDRALWSRWALEARIERHEAGRTELPSACRAFGADLDLRRRGSMKAQMKYADKLGARHTIVLREEIELGTGGLR